ncbi:extracellular solute-binding protein [Paenibacillus sp. PAMC21692]|uniref:extracellular solute-binding protein n=1 Tax=Paenibacillus sp. PAMC21692 TaxID=2762320 RepID=UPI00164D6B23|nr:extracellular solute-binding protein [Paenibacillus sp. PAMC21692]QNK58805.1 extracellular solute-binding protein [Paenibacillus sp. PAMC21692]
MIRSKWLQIGITVITVVALAVIIFIWNKQSAIESQDRPHLTIMLRMGDSFRNTDNPYIQELEKQLGMDIEVMNVPASSYNDQLNVAMASGGVADIVQINWSGEVNFSGWVRSGLILPIDLKQAPNIEYNTQPSLLSLMRVGEDDRIYGVPGTTTSYPYGVIIRKDWLDQLGLGIPRTLKEYERVLEAFVTLDPDGDGRSNTVGVTSWRLNQFGGIFGGAFKTDYLWNSLHPDAGDAEGKVVFREQQAGYMSFMNFAKKAFEMQWLDNDFPYLQNAEHKFILGKTGMIGGYSNQTLQLEKELQRFVPEARLEWILGPADSEGRHWNFSPESYGYRGGGSMIGDQAVFVITQNANYDAALRFLDAMSTREMILFANLGIQGVHYESYDLNRNIVIRTPQQVEAVNRDLFGISDTYRKESLVLLGDNERENDRLEYYRKKGMLLITRPSSFSSGFASDLVHFQMMNPNFKERERNTAIQYVTGDMDREEYLGYLEQENRLERQSLAHAIQERYLQLSQPHK